MGKEYGIEFLPSDFKKKNGYKRSTELSREHALYRQNYCGCVFSKREAEERTGAANRRHRRDQYKTPFFSVRSITPVSKSQSRQEKSFGQVWR